MFVQEDYRSVIAVPYDIPVLGYGNNTVNSLRIWDAEPVNTFNLNSFDKGDYQKAIEEENLAKNIVEVLYPNDNHYAGKELRLKQQYFFCLQMKTCGRKFLSRCWIRGFILTASGLAASHWNNISCSMRLGMCIWGQSISGCRS